MPYEPNQPNLQRLKKAYAEGTKRTVFFIGAGCSVEVGLPTWRGLLEKLQNRILCEVSSVNADEQILENYRRLEELANGDDFWKFFDHANNHWPTTYADYMQDELISVAGTASIPKVYEKIWSMRSVKQVFTLNIDGLVTRAFFASKQRAEHQLFEYNGFNVTDSLQYLARDAYMVVNLHGKSSEPSSWIMNETERQRLISGVNSEKYTSFLTRLFSEYNVVFVGVNPADIAISPSLRKAKSLDLLGDHYWIVPAPTADNERWAQANRIRLIRYQPDFSSEGEQAHSLAILSILSDIEAFVSHDVKVELPQSITPTSVDLSLSASDLSIQLSTDRLSAVRSLSGKAAQIIEKHGFQSTAFSSFCEDYTVPIQISCIFKPGDTEYNRLHVYKIRQLIQNKGASSVWLVESAEPEGGNYYAAKILNGTAFADQIERESFRRGIESIYLLSQADLSVGPRYICHYEVPLSLIMELISGHSLRDFVENSHDRSELVLGVMSSVSSAIQACHRSSGEVLHRDLRPGNVLLENWFIGYDPSQIRDSTVRLINFDLSWHRFTSGNTKAISAFDVGFYAPEQRNAKNSAPPRTAATDVYMLGMVFYYLICGEVPPDGGATVGSWEELVKRKMGSGPKDEMVKNRLSRLILSMTRPEINDRIDMTNVEGEIEALIAWRGDVLSEIDDDFFVENLALSTRRPYRWDSASLSALVGLKPEIEFKVAYQQRGRRATFSFSRTRDHSDRRAGFGEKIRQRVSSVGAMLSGDGWETSVNGNRGLDASIRIEDLKALPGKGGARWEVIADQLLATFD